MGQFANKLLAGRASPVTSPVYEIQISYAAEVEVGEAIGNIIGSIIFFLAANRALH